MALDKDARISLQYDYYGMLLSERQREVMNLYHEENLSLTEIAEELGISRQGVHDSLKNAQAVLGKYEGKLGLVHRFEETAEAINRIDLIIDELIKGNCGNNKIEKQLIHIKEIIDNID